VDSIEPLDASSSAHVPPNAEKSWKPAITASPSATTIAAATEPRDELRIIPTTSSVAPGAAARPRVARSAPALIDAPLTAAATV
jgi:hypothetical protein